MTAQTLTRGFIATAAMFALTLAALAQAPASKNFDVPADLATNAIKTFSIQSGVEVLMPTDAVTGVRTNEVKGEMTPRQALETMVADTGFVVIQDEKTGALGLRAAAVPEMAAVTQPSRAAARATSEDEAVKLDEYRVLGTRIRQTETEGPSPVNTYDRDFISSTGSMTLADFLNRIPQAYSGVASGRGSAPDEFNPEFGQRTETSSPAFNFVLGASAIIPTQSGVSGVSLRGLGAGSTLVLVDGRRVAQSGAGNRGTDTRQGFVDLNSIPLGMIERIEVITDGASAIYGADAVAGVINIILKKNYTGTEVSGGVKTAEHGGGRERNASITTGFAYGKLSGTVSLDYYDRENISASERSFSAVQDHSSRIAGTLNATGAPRFGINYTLNWGYPAVVQASGGTVSGTFNAIPGVRVVLVPVGAVATPTVAQFTPVTAPVPPATAINASQQRRANTAEFLDLVGESQRRGAGGTFKYLFNDRLEANLNYRTSEAESFFRSQPTTSITGSFGAPVLLPAAFNPFNQNVLVGMVLNEWGSSSQRVRTVSDAIGGGLQGNIGTWQWDLNYSWQEQGVRQRTRSFHGPGLAGLLINPDPARRFNPFIDSRAPGAVSQAAILDTLSLYPEVYSISNFEGFEFSADGDLFDYWGGTLKLAVGGSTGNSEIWSRITSYSTAVVPVASTAVVQGGQRSEAFFGELFLPVFAKDNAAPLLQRLDFTIAARHEENGAFTETVPKFGVSWSPLKQFLIRGSVSEGFRAPGPTEYLVVSPPFNSTLQDPKRTPPSTTGVVTTRGSNPNPKAEASESTFVGLIYEPEFAKGLNFQVNYYETIQTDVLQVISAQNILNNEALFPGRVTRAAPTPADTALNQPGRVTGVDQTFLNFGKVVNRSLDISADYVLPMDDYGRFRMNVSASHTLEATRQVAPGQPPVILEDDTASPPKWKLNASLYWSKGPWNASAFVWYLGGFESNNAGSINVANSTAVTYFPTPSVTKLDLRFGYEFKEGVWRGYGKKLRVNFGVNNVFDKEPPFSATLFGFNAGLHSQLILGRGYELSFSVPIM